MRERCKTDLYYLAAVVLGYWYLEFPVDLEGNPTAHAKLAHFVEDARTYKKKPVANVNRRLA